jgi:uncharacterized protein YndB with AHSA1/START domain
MSEPPPAYVYVVYIRSTLEAVYAALTSLDVRPWWFNRLVVGEYKVGGQLTQYSNAERTAIDLYSEVLEMDPPRRLTTTFFVEGGAFPVTTVTYELIALAGGNVKLIVTHEGLDAGLRDGVSKGWPAILSGLKSTLETGRNLDLERDDEGVGQ